MRRGRRRRPGPQKGEIGLVHIAFRLRDEEHLRAAYRELKEKQVPILSTVDHGITKSIYFRDPDGHQLEVYCDNSPEYIASLGNSYAGMDKLDFAAEEPGINESFAPVQAHIASALRNAPGPHVSTLMGIRTGKEFVESLRDERTIYVNGERVKDVTEYSPFRGIVATLASLYDLQHERRDELTFRSPKTGDRGRREFPWPRRLRPVEFRASAPRRCAPTYARSDGPDAGFLQRDADRLRGGVVPIWARATRVSAKISRAITRSAAIATGA